MNTRFLDACWGKPVDRTPVWLMRQAGRYMVEYRAVRAHHSLLEICKRPELAAEVMRGFEELTRPQYSYRLVLDGNDLVWVSEEGGREVRLRKDPEVGFWRRLSTGCLSIFAPESLL